MKLSQLILVIGLVFVAIFSRWLPHPANFTAVGAVALLIGSVFRTRGWVLLLPVIMMLVSDLALGFHASMGYVYGAFLIIALMGLLIPDKNYFQKNQIFRIFGLALSASFVFFMITNFGVWMSAGLYPQTASGLIECFLMGLPFLKNQIAGDLIFSGTLFFVYEIFARRLELRTAETSVQ